MMRHGMIIMWTRSRHSARCNDGNAIRTRFGAQRLQHHGDIARADGHLQPGEILDLGHFPTGSVQPAGVSHRDQDGPKSGEIDLGVLVIEFQR